MRAPVERCARYDCPCLRSAQSQCPLWLPISPFIPHKRRWRSRRASGAAVLADQHVCTHTGR